MAEPKNPSLPRMREWPMFCVPPRHRAKTSREGRPLPRIADLVMERVAGTPAEKLAWLRDQMAANRLDGDDADEVAEAEALLVMLVRLSAASHRRERRHLDEFLDEGLRETFPASDPVAVGHFTGTEPLSQPLDRDRSLEQSATHGAAMAARGGEGERRENGRGSAQRLR